MDKLKFIKTVVVLITFLLVFGSLLLMTVIYQKATADKPDTYHEISLEQPSGSSIVSVTRSDDELVLLVKGGGLADRLIMVNPQTLKKTSAINL